MIAAVVSRPRARRLLACAGAGLLAALPALAVGGAPGAAAVQTVAGTPATATAPGLLTLYARNRAEGIPNYVTEDLLLIGYSLAAREATKALEDQAIRPRFADFIAALATGLAALPTATAAAQTPDATPAVTAQATQANRTYLAVLLALLGTDQAAARAALPAGPASAEFDLVVAAQGIAPSPLWGYPLDYGQFKPRGRYTEDPALAAYFRAMRYAGALLFPVQGSAATGVTPETAARMTVQALQLVDVIAADPRLKEQRDTLEGLLAWHFGPADDLSDADLGQVRAVHPDAAPAAVAQALLAYAKTHGHQPRILGGLVDADRLEPGLTTRDVLTGWRLLPARYSADSAAFQRLVYDATGAYQGGVADADGTAPVEYEAEGGTIRARYANGVKLVMRLAGFNGEGTWLGLGTCPVRFEGDLGWVEAGDHGKIVTSDPALLATNRPSEMSGTDPSKNVRDFLDCVKSRGKPACNSTVARYGHIACHAAAIAWKLGRKLRFDPKTESFIDDAEADKMRTRERRAPWNV
jgi:hypothetical protein